MKVFLSLPILTSEFVIMLVTGAHKSRSPDRQGYLVLYGGTKYM